MGLQRALILRFVLFLLQPDLLRPRHLVLHISVEADCRNVGDRAAVFAAIQMLEDPAFLLDSDMRETPFKCGKLLVGCYRMWGQPLQFE